jgi:uncharacterized membrane protein (DUF106 family)
LATFPERALWAVNSALGWLVDLVLYPLLGLPPLLSLLVVSVLTAAAMLPVIARTSDQKRLAETKRRIHAALLEIRLFNDDPRAVLRSLGDAFRLNVRYLRLSLVPLLWMALPLTLVVTHLQSIYGYSGLEPGVPALVKMDWRMAQGATSGSPHVELQAPDAVHVETGAVQLASSNEVLWRVVPATPGDYLLTIRAGGATESKTLHASGGPARRSPLRSSNVLDQLLYPSEPPLAPPSPIARIAVTYPDAGIAVFGWNVHWLVVYLVLTMAAAFVIARWFGVTI